MTVSPSLQRTLAADAEAPPAGEMEQLAEQDGGGEEDINDVAAQGEQVQQQVDGDDDGSDQVALFTFLSCCRSSPSSSCDLTSMILMILSSINSEGRS